MLTYLYINVHIPLYIFFIGVSTRNQCFFRINFNLSKYLNYVVVIFIIDHWNTSIINLYLI